MELNKHDIAERFAALAPGKQKEFLVASLRPFVWTNDFS